MDCISSTTTSAPLRFSRGMLPCSRITASTRLSSDAPTRAATSRPAVPWDVETSSTPPSRMVLRRSMVERRCPRMALARLEDA